MRCIVKDNMKLVINLLSDDELYDLDSDPYECRNLINDTSYREKRNALHDELLEKMNLNRDPFRAYYWERRPWRDDAREATWQYTDWTRQRGNEEYEPFMGDALTVNGYLGSDGINPLIKVCKENDKGIFVLVKTSNPSSGELQDLLINSVCSTNH